MVPAPSAQCCQYCYTRTPSIAHLRATSAHWEHATRMPSQAASKHVLPSTASPAPPSLCFHYAQSQSSLCHWWHAVGMQLCLRSALTQLGFTAQILNKSSSSSGEKLVSDSNTLALTLLQQIPLREVEGHGAGNRATSVWGCHLPMTLEWHVPWESESPWPHRNPPIPVPRGPCPQEVPIATGGLQLGAVP